jgi:hypothetical protein
MTEEQRYHGRLGWTATAIDPLHHGAGTEGNTQILRMQDVVLPDGTVGRVPFVSGNSLKHVIRDGGMRFALEAMGVQAGTLSKAVVDLLFSGGALTKSGTAVNLAQARDISELFPILAVCGYAAGNFMQASKIRVEHLHLACTENAWRAPASLTDAPQLAKRAATFRAEEFGTRHEPTKDPRVFALLEAVDRDARLRQLSGNVAEGEKKQKSQQMLYEFQVVAAGSVWFGGLTFDDFSTLELAALRSSLERASIGTAADGAPIYCIGAKASVGFGRMAFNFDGGLRETISPPQFSPAEAIMPMGANADTDAMGAYVAHLREHRDAILGALRDLA